MLYNNKLQLYNNPKPEVQVWEGKIVTTAKEQRTHPQISCSNALQRAGAQTVTEWKVSD